jgi:hypothetical protein
MTVASSAQAVLVAIRRGVLSSIASSTACWRCPMAAAVALLQGLSRERIDVEREDGEDVAAADREDADALKRARRRGPWRAFVDDAIEELAGSPGAFRRRARQDRGAENGDLAVVVDEGGRLRRCRRRYELRQILRRDADVDDGGGGNQRHAKRDRAQPHGKARRPVAVFHNVSAIG